MARWKQDFDNHQIHSTIYNAEELYKQALESTNASATHELRRIGKVINEIKVILQKVDPETVPFRWLTNLEKAFQEHNFESQMHGFVDTGEISYLNDVNQTIADKVLEPLYLSLIHI